MSHHIRPLAPATAARVAAAAAVPTVHAAAALAVEAMGTLAAAPVPSTTSNDVHPARLLRLHLDVTLLPASLVARADIATPADPHDVHAVWSGYLAPAVASAVDGAPRRRYVAALASLRHIAALCSAVTIDASLGRACGGVSVTLRLSDLFGGLPVRCRAAQDGCSGPLRWQQTVAAFRAALHPSIAMLSSHRHAVHTADAFPDVVVNVWGPLDRSVAFSVLSPRADADPSPPTVAQEDASSGRGEEEEPPSLLAVHSEQLRRVAAAMFQGAAGDADTDAFFCSTDERSQTGVVFAAAAADTEGPERAMRALLASLGRGDGTAHAKPALPLRVLLHSTSSSGALRLTFAPSDSPVAATCQSIAASLQRQGLRVACVLPREWSGCLPASLAPLVRVAEAPATDDEDTSSCGEDPTVPGAAGASDAMTRARAARASWQAMRLSSYQHPAIFAALAKSALGLRHRRLGLPPDRHRAVVALQQLRAVTGHAPARPPLLLPRPRSSGGGEASQPLPPPPPESTDPDTVERGRTITQRPSVPRRSHGAALTALTSAVRTVEGSQGPWQGSAVTAADQSRALAALRSKRPRSSDRLTSLASPARVDPATGAWSAPLPPPQLGATVNVARGRMSRVSLFRPHDAAGPADGQATLSQRFAQFESTVQRPVEALRGRTLPQPGSVPRYHRPMAQPPVLIPRSTAEARRDHARRAVAALRAPLSIDDRSMDDGRVAAAPPAHAHASGMEAPAAAPPSAAPAVVRVPLLLPCAVHDATLAHENFVAAAVEHVPEGQLRERASAAGRRRGTDDFVKKGRRGAHVRGLFSATADKIAREADDDVFGGASGPASLPGEESAPGHGGPVPPLGPGLEQRFRRDGLYLVPERAVVAGSRVVGQFCRRFVITAADTNSGDGGAAPAVPARERSPLRRLPAWTAASDTAHHANPYAAPPPLDQPTGERDLLIIDQHALHERLRLEAFVAGGAASVRRYASPFAAADLVAADYAFDPARDDAETKALEQTQATPGGGGGPTPCGCIPTALSVADLAAASVFHGDLRAWGWRPCPHRPPAEAFFAGSRCGDWRRVSHVPALRIEAVQRSPKVLCNNVGGALAGFLAALAAAAPDADAHPHARPEPAAPHVVPPCITAAVVSRSCRGAVMFGDGLSVDFMRGLVAAAGTSTQYAVCSHGRRSMAALASVG